MDYRLQMTRRTPGKLTVMIRLSGALILCSMLFNACGIFSSKAGSSDSGVITQSGKPGVPAYNYTVKPPKHWSVYDTAMQGLKVRFIIPPAFASGDHPVVNILIAFMDNRELEDFTTRNMHYLERNMEGVVLQEKGNMHIGGKSAKWFTYTKVQDGMTRDMINYIIPVNGFAYMITCGTKKGSMDKYRKTFDKMARSFKI